MKANLLKTSIAAVALAGGFSLAVSLAAMGATSDSQTSADNSKLSCQVSITDQGKSAVVTWTITGAISASIEPLSFKDGKVPLKGSQSVDTNGVLHVFLVAKDANGHTVRCHAGLGGTADPATGTTGFNDLHYTATQIVGP